VFWRRLLRVLRQQDADVRARTAPIKGILSIVDRYEDMIIEAAEGEGDKRNLLFTNVPREREFAITGFLPYDEPDSDRIGLMWRQAEDGTGSMHSVIALPLLEFLTSYHFILYLQ
jgi:hypothetical protein